MTFDPGPLADVSAEPSDEQWKLVFTREFRYPCERVWDALTQPDQLAKWSPWLASHPLDQLGDVTLTMIDGDNREPMAATVVRVDRPHVLEYRMGPDHFMWELTPKDNAGSVLVLQHTTDKRDMMPMVAAGWHLCLAVADAALAGKAQEPIRGQDARNYGWEGLAKEYGETLEIPYTGWPFDE